MFRQITFLTILLAVLIGGACTAAVEKPTGAGTPTDAYKQLFAAVKAKDIEGIKRTFSKKTNDFAAMAAGRQNSPVDEVYKNGFTATTFADTLPSIRDERIKDDMGAVEVWNSKESKWEDLPFVNEDGGWKLAVGDMFAGSYKSPGSGRDMLEKQAANAVSGGAIPVQNSNANGAPVNRSAEKK